MSFTFRPAKLEGVGLIVGVAGPSGGGKTWSAMLLAQGMSGGKRFAVIDTEAGRAKHYAGYFSFDHGDLFGAIGRRFLGSYVSAMRTQQWIPSDCRLSKREVECLRWAAVGKTDRTTINWQVNR